MLISLKEKIKKYPVDTEWTQTKFMRFCCFGDFQLQFLYLCNTNFLKHSIFAKIKVNQNFVLGVVYTGRAES